MKPKFKGTPGKWKTYKGNDRWVVRGGNIVAVVHDGKHDGLRGRGRFVVMGMSIKSW